MKTFLVRLKSNHELVGLFSSPAASLWRVIDEVCDVALCEYLELPIGGLYLPEAGAAAVPALISDPENESPPDFLTGAVISEGWFEVFHEEQDWQSIDMSE